MVRELRATVPVLAVPVDIGSDTFSIDVGTDISPREVDVATFACGLSSVATVDRSSPI